MGFINVVSYKDDVPKMPESGVIKFFPQKHTHGKCSLAAHCLGAITRIKRVSTLIPNPSFLSQRVAPPPTYQNPGVSSIPPCPLPPRVQSFSSPVHVSPETVPCSLSQPPLFCFRPLLSSWSLHHPAWPSASPLPF